MSEPSIPEIEELIGVYALDAVDDDERNAVERHLAVCAMPRRTGRAPRGGRAARV